jgi:hypothetical protein
MLDFTKFFMQGLKKTLRLQNGVNFSYKGPWVQLYPDTILDEWFVGDFCAAEYNIVIDLGNEDKEMIKCLVTAGVEQADVVVYGRTNLGRNLADVTATVDASRLKLFVDPAISDDSAGGTGAKVIYSATYYYNLNELGA